MKSFSEIVELDDSSSDLISSLSSNAKRKSHGHNEHSKPLNNKRSRLDQLQQVCLQQELDSDLETAEDEVSTVTSTTTTENLQSRLCPEGSTKTRGFTRYSNLQFRCEEEATSSSCSSVTPVQVTTRVSTLMNSARENDIEEDEVTMVTTITTVEMEVEMDVDAAAAPTSELDDDVDENEEGGVGAAGFKYVLSSGRQTVPQQNRRIVTIDDEFEQYFAQLMI